MLRVRTNITLGELLQWAAETTPERIALIAGIPDRENRRQWTYAELYAQALRTARALKSRFAPGERVAIWAYNIPEWIMMEFGAAMAGTLIGSARRKKAVAGPAPSIAADSKTSRGSPPM